MQFFQSKVKLARSSIEDAKQAVMAIASDAEKQPQVLFQRTLDQFTEQLESQQLSIVRKEDLAALYRMLRSQNGDSEVRSQCHQLVREMLYEEPD